MWMVKAEREMDEQKGENAPDYRALALLLVEMFN